MIVDLIAKALVALFWCGVVAVGIGCVLWFLGFLYFLKFVNSLESFDE